MTIVGGKRGKLEGLEFVLYWFTEKYKVKEMKTAQDRTVRREIGIAGNTDEI